MSSSSNRVILLCILSLVVICSLFFLSGETPITTSQGFTDRPVETTDDLVLSQTAAAADASQDNQSTSAASPPPKIDKSDRVPQDKDAQVEAATEMDQDSWHDLLLSGKDAKNFTWEETDFVVEQVVNQMSIGLPETPLRYAVLNRHEGVRVGLFPIFITFGSNNNLHNPHSLFS